MHNYKKILILDTIWAPGLEILKKRFIIDVIPGLSEEKLVEVINPYNIIVLKSGNIISKKVLSNASNLKLIIRAGSSLDNIDLVECKRKNINVISTHESVTIAVAEFTVAAILSVCRRLPLLFQATKNKDFRRYLYIGKELRDLNVGLLGLGRIGIKTASMLRPFGCNLIGYSKNFSRKSEFEEIGGKVTNDLNYLLSQSDIISLHLPLNGETKYIINKDTLNYFKKGAILINTA